MQWWHESKKPTYDGITFQSSKTSDGINKFGGQSETFIPKVSASFNTEIGFLRFFATLPLARWNHEKPRSGEDRSTEMLSGYPSWFEQRSNLPFPNWQHFPTSRTRCQTTLAPQFLLDHLWWHKGGTQGPLLNAGIGHFNGLEWIQSPLSLLETCGMSSHWCHC